MDLDGFDLRDAPQCMQDIARTVDKAGMAGRPRATCPAGEDREPRWQPTLACPGRDLRVKGWISHLGGIR
jgi:hypothetical protein